MGGRAGKVTKPVILPVLLKPDACSLKPQSAAGWRWIVGRGRPWSFRVFPDRIRLNVGRFRAGGIGCFTCVS